MALAIAPPAAVAPRDTKQRMRDAGASLAKDNKKRKAEEPEVEVAKDNKKRKVHKEPEVAEGPEVEEIEEPRSPEVEVLEEPPMPDDFPSLDLTFDKAQPKWRNNLHSRVYPRVKAYWLAKGKTPKVACELASAFWIQTRADLGI